MLMESFVQSAREDIKEDNIYTSESFQEFHLVFSKDLLAFAKGI